MWGTNATSVFAAFAFCPSVRSFLSLSRPSSSHLSAARSSLVRRAPPSVIHAYLQPKRSGATSSTRSSLSSAHPSTSWDQRTTSASTPSCTSLISFLTRSLRCGPSLLCRFARWPAYTLLGRSTLVARLNHRCSQFYWSLRWWRWGRGSQVAAPCGCQTVPRLMSSTRSSWPLRRSTFSASASSRNSTTRVRDPNVACILSV